MKKKIIFIQSYKFLDFHYMQYEIENLKKYFDVECHDLTLIKNKKIEFHYRYLKNKFKINKFNDPKTWEKKIFQELDKYHDNLIICFMHFPTTFYELYIYWKLIKKKTNVCVFNFNSMIALNSNIKLKIYEIIFYKIIRLLSRPKQIINHKKISFINFILKKISKYIYPKYIFVNSKQDFSINKKNWENSKILRLHSWDGSKSINFKNKKKIKNKKMATYLSAFSINSASDSANYNTSRTENSKKILKSVNKFFIKLEKNFNFKIKIAKHPREEDNFNSPIYKNKKRFASKYLTNELIYASNLVITTMSTAISFAVLYKKPILFVITNEHYKNVSLIQYTKSVSDHFKSDLINIDLNKNFLINLRLSNFTLNKYKSFKKDYLVYGKFKNLTNSQLLTNILK